MKIINEVEVATKLAHTRTLFDSGDICNNEDDMFEDFELKKYKAEIQERFNSYYDYYLDILTKDSEDFEQYRKESVKWSVCDFIGRSEELGVKITTDEAQILLEVMISDHDAGTGVNWHTLDYYIENKNEFL